MPKIITKKYELTYLIEDEIVILDNIYVDPIYRGKGIGISAMNRFVKKFSNRKIELHAYAQDDLTCTKKLVSFYEKFGFSVKCGELSYGFEMTNY